MFKRSRALITDSLKTDVRFEHRGYVTERRF